MAYFHRSLGQIDDVFDTFQIIGTKVTARCESGRTKSMKDVSSMLENHRVFHVFSCSNDFYWG